MSILRVDIRPVLAEMNQAIDEWVIDRDEPRVLSEIRALTEQIPTLTERRTFTNHVRKLLMCGNPDRAKGLIGALGPDDWTPLAVVLGHLLLWAARIGFLAGLVALLMWVLR